MLDLDIPYVSDAEHRLHQLVVQRSQRLIGAAVLLAVTVASVFVFPEVAFGFAAGAAAAVAAALVALDRRRSLTAQLIQTRAAYNIDYVARTGAQFASRARRGRLAAWLRDIVRIAEHQEVRGSYTTPIIEQRVIERKQRLLALAVALEDHDQALHPAGVAIVHRMLTRPGLSPLYNPGLPEETLDEAIRRAEACVERLDPV